MKLLSACVAILIGVVSSTAGAAEVLPQEEIHKLEHESMLFQANELSKKISGEGIQWVHPYAMPAPSHLCVPQPEKVCDIASAWFTAYPRSMIIPSGSSVLYELGSNGLWDIFEDIGIDAMHTAPLKLSGQMVDGKIEPSIDGGFDRIGYGIDPLFGTRHEYLEMVKTAEKHNALIAGDLVPGHTGKGPDFLLALRDYKDYPGIYHMVEIDKKNWDLLPDVPKDQEVTNLSPAQVEKLKEKHYIIGKMDKIYFYDPKVKLTNWSVTPEIMGVDGKVRRWVYLHFFKAGQPSLNWLDPTFGGNRIVAGDIVISLGTYKAKILRLDANAFLGEEIVPGKEKALSYGHPLSIIASDIISMLTRKLGGFTFQELDASIKMMKAFMKFGPDFAYDFLTRGAYMDALAFQDATILRLVTKQMMEENLAPNRLIHALQNHDEFNLSYNFLGLTPDKLYTYKGVKISGKVLQEKLREADIRAFTGPETPYNTFNDSGVSSTIVGMIAATIGVGDVYEMTKQQKEQVLKAHLLVTFYNAMQPGIFALSGWDLMGALPLKQSEMKKWLDKDQDTRWLNRGAYEMMGQNTDINQSIVGIPRASTLYTPIPIQLREPCSYASNVKKILAARKKWGVPQATLIDIPEVSPQFYVAMYCLPKSEDLLMVALNFGQTEHTETISSEKFVGKEAWDIVRERSEKKEKQAKGFNLILAPYETKALVFQSKAPNTEVPKKTESSAPTKKTP